MEKANTMIICGYNIDMCGIYSTYLGKVNSREFFVHSEVDCMWHHHSMASDYCNFVYVFVQMVIVLGIDILSIGSMRSNHRSLQREEEKLGIMHKNSINTTWIRLIKTNGRYNFHTQIKFTLKNCFQ